MIGNWIRRLLIHLARRLRPREGWPALLVLAAALGVLAWAVQEAGWARHAPDLISPTLLAMLTGVLISRRPRSPRASAGLALLSSSLILPLTAAQAWPPLSLLIANLRGLLALLRHPDQPFSTLPAPAWMGERLLRWGESLAAWARTGQDQGDGVALAFLILLLLWGAGLWAGWQAFHNHTALTALAPAGVLLAANHFFALSGLAWLLIFMAALLTLALILRDYTLRRDWELHQIDYSPELRLELYAAGLAVTLLVVALMPLAPNLRLRPLQRAFWQVFDAPYAALSIRAEALFPQRGRTPRGLLPDGPLGAGGLPRAHLLAGDPQLREQVILYVRVSDAAGGDGNYRWRGLTFDRYNGRGWDPPEIVETVDFAPGEMWLLLQGRRPLRQTVEFVDQTPYWLYAMGEAVAADRPYRAHLRGPGDAVGLEVQAREYVVLSQAPALTETQLRAAGPPPAAIAARYLALPATLPARVPALARSIVAAAATPYDQARAVESYLRRFPYTLDIPAPPPGVDVVDYFLFDLQQGYCDYYAASMVVLARSLGLPARLAVGYAAGAYDPVRERFTVVEADAHSWPELYFAGFGWIPFEPTAAQPRFDFAPAGVEDAPALDLAVEQAALRRRWLRQGWLRWSAALLGVLLAAGAARLLWAEWRLRRQAAHAWHLAYLRLQRWGRRLDVPAVAGDTPREYAARWQAALAGRAPAPLLTDIARLSQGLETRAYAPASQHPPAAAAGRLWRRLQPWLWRLWLTRRREK